MVPLKYPKTLNCPSSDRKQYHARTKIQAFTIKTGWKFDLARLLSEGRCNKGCKSLHMDFEGFEGHCKRS